MIIIGDHILSKVCFLLYLLSTRSRGRKIAWAQEMIIWPYKRLKDWHAPMLHTQWIEDLFAIWVHVGWIDGQLIGLTGWLDTAVHIPQASVHLWLNTHLLIHVARRIEIIHHNNVQKHVVTIFRRCRSIIWMQMVMKWTAKSTSCVLHHQ